jgi:hypothetical protein
LSDDTPTAPKIGSKLAELFKISGLRRVSHESGVPGVCPRVTRREGLTHAYDLDDYNRSRRRAEMGRFAIFMAAVMATLVVFKPAMLKSTGQSIQSSIGDSISA